MSTVLWANYLSQGNVVSAESDLYALYKHANKLDKITRALGLIPFLDVHDTTDAQYNLSNDELPSGIETTDQLMAVKGVWIAASEALIMLEQLSAHIDREQIRFGILSNAQTRVLDELADSILFARKAAEIGATFNFSVVL